MSADHEGQIKEMFDELSEVQGGDGRLNFPLFGELLTPPPDLTGTGPFGQDYRLKEIAGVERRRAMLDAAIAANPASQRWAAGERTRMRSWKFDDGGVPALQTRSGQTLTAALATATPVDPNASLSHSFNRSLEPKGYVVPDAPPARVSSLPQLPTRTALPRRLGQRPANKGTHAHLVQPIPESAMWQPESTRLVRSTHFADKWDSGADKARRQAVWNARAERRAYNEQRVAEMVQERQENNDLADLCRSRSLGSQSLWLMNRTVGQM